MEWTFCIKVMKRTSMLSCVIFIITQIQKTMQSASTKCSTTNCNWLIYLPAGSFCGPRMIYPCDQQGRFMLQTRPTITSKRFFTRKPRRLLVCDDRSNECVPSAATDVAFANGIFASPDGRNVFVSSPKPEINYCFMAGSSVWQAHKRRTKEFQFHKTRQHHAVRRKPFGGSAFLMQFALFSTPNLRA